MNISVHAVRLGLARGWTEFRASAGRMEEMGFTIFMSAVVVGVLFLQRGRTIDGTSVTVAMTTLPSVVGLMVAMGGSGAAGALAVEREDGTLLRAKAIPHGLTGYLVGRTVSVSLLSVVGVLIILLPGLVVVPELVTAGLASWSKLTWVVPLGLLATLPWGAVFGSLAKSPNNAFVFTVVPISVLATISGIFYPITAMPGWVQAVAQLFPVYWLGLGVRSALLPAAAVATELGQSWRPGLTVAVLTAWAMAGFVTVPPILGRMARGESGSAMQQRRHQAQQRVG